MAQSKRPHFGDLPPMYKFIMNPYPDYRISRCYECENKTGQRKLPLLIHIDPGHLIALNYTNRYCKTCDLLIAHKHEIEHYLTEVFRQYDPEVIGNDYFIIGTVEKKSWREGMKRPQMPKEIIPHTHDFMEYWSELRLTRPGWYPENYEPPAMEPPPSKEWVKG
jgi:hypothetical protein